MDRKKSSVITLVVKITDSCRFSISKMNAHKARFNDSGGIMFEIPRQFVIESSPWVALFVFVRGKVVRHTKRDFFRGRNSIKDSIVIKYISITIPIVVAKIILNIHHYLPIKKCKMLTRETVYIFSYFIYCNSRNA